MIVVLTAGVVDLLAAPDEPDQLRKQRGRVEQVHLPAVE